MKIKKTLSLLLVAVLVLGLLSGCGKKKDPQYLGDVDETIVADNTPDTNQDVVASMPTYNYKTLPASDALQPEEHARSYYFSLLPERNQVVFEEIYHAAEEFQTEVILSKQPSPKELEKIMNIIYLDTAELYMLDTTYTYDTDSNGYVYKIYLSYILTEEENQDISSKMTQTFASSISGFIRQKTQLGAEEAIMKSIRGLYNTRPTYSLDGKSQDVSASLLSSAYSALILRGANHIAVSKLFSYYARMSGLNAAVVVGELTSTDFAESIKLDIPAYKEPAEAIRRTVDGTHVTVTCDYSSFYTWNIVQINGEWYQVDCLMPTLLKQAKKDLDFSDPVYGLLENVPDYTISQSRLFYVNEEMLGQTPECKSTTFQAFYRSGDFFLNYTEPQNTVATMNLLDDLLRTNTKKKLIQFQTEDGFNIFIKNIDKLIKTYNTNNNNPIRGYEIFYNRETLSVYLYDIIFINKN